LAQQGIQDTKFVVHLDSKSLKNSTDAGIALGLVLRPAPSSVELMEQSGKFPGSGDRLGLQCGDDGLRQGFGHGFVCVVPEGCGQLFGCGTG
jgi:hypothetical protein